MGAKLLSVAVGRDTSTRVLTVRFDGEEKTTKRYTVPEEDYLRLGAPAEDRLLTEEDCAYLVEVEQISLAMQKAGHILSASDNSAAALLRKLRERGIPAPIAQEVTARVVALGYIDEAAQLRRFIPQLVHTRKWGPRRILPYLISRGYPRGTVGEILRELTDAGVVDFDALREEVLAALPPDTDARTRAKELYKHGL